MSVVWLGSTWLPRLEMAPPQSVVDAYDMAAVARVSCNPAHSRRAAADSQ